MTVVFKEIDRSKALSWWTGRISNADLALSTGQTERDVRLILGTKYFKGQIIGGGRGASRTRRITKQARNAVPIIGAMRRAGMTIEAASKIINTLPVLASFPTPVIDFSPGTGEDYNPYSGAMSMLMVDDPDGGWTPFDTVPRHVFNGRARPMAPKDKDVWSVGDAVWFPDWVEEGAGRLPEGLRPLGEPIYRPEIDPLGVYEFGNDLPDTHDGLDHHFYIVNGRWLWIRHPHVEPRQYMLDLHLYTIRARKERQYSNSSDFDYDLALEITDSGEAVTVTSAEQEDAAKRAWEQPETKLDVNATYAVRRMKRRFLGLVKE